MLSKWGLQKHGQWIEVELKGLKKKKIEVVRDRISSLLFLKYSSGFPAVIKSADGEVALEVNEEKKRIALDWLEYCRGHDIAFGNKWSTVAAPL